MKRSTTAVVGALMLSSCASLARGGGKVAGCYTANPALTYDKSGISAHGDTSFALLQLMPGGRATRPLVPPGPMPTGVWRLVKDTLRVAVADGYTGWLLVLRFHHGAWVGDAKYESDLVIVGAPPYHHEIELRPRACVGAG